MPALCLGHFAFFVCRNAFHVSIIADAYIRFFSSPYLYLELKLQCIYINTVVEVFVFDFFSLRGEDIGQTFC